MITNSIVIPVYKNAESIPQLLSELEAVANKIGHCELVFVVDGSPDLSFDILREKLAALKTASQLVSLSRNFGSFQAIMCGLFVAKGQFCSVLSASA